MKYQVIILLACVVFASAAPLDDPKNAQIIKYENDNIGIDGYSFAYETSDGVSRQEQARLNNPGTDNEAISISGSITWQSPEGQSYTLTFVADENGFQPEAAHLPK